MATATGKNRCSICDKERRTVVCDGCSQAFCYNHLGDHRQELSRQMDDIEVTRDLFRQTLTEQTSQPQKHSLMQKIDEWERDSIKKIRRTAEEARTQLLKHTTGHIAEIEVQLNKLTDQLRHSRQENDFVETDLNEWKEELNRLKDELTKPSNIILREDATSLVTKINVDVSIRTSLNTMGVGANTRWIQKGITVAGDNGKGNGLHQLSDPYGVYIDSDLAIYIADQANHRIVQWKYGATNGLLVAAGNERGNENNQLNFPMNVILHKESDNLIISDRVNRRIVQWPRQNGANGQTIISDVSSRGFAIDNRGYLYVSDYEKHEVRRWRIGDVTGTLVAGGNGKGNRLDQLNGPTHIFVDQNHSIYVSDSGNHRVMKWKEGATEGIVVAGDQAQGSGLTQLSWPYGVVADQLESVYVTDYNNHRVMHWPKGATEGHVIVGGKGQGGQADQLNGPVGLTFDRQGNLYVVDQKNYRVQKFNIDSSLNS